MQKLAVLFVFICLGIYPSFGKGEMTYISAEISGFEGKTVYFDFINQGDASTSFTYQENKVLEWNVELEDLSMVNINTWISMCVEPGDTIHAKIVYEGRYHKSVEYTGSPKAVAASNLLQNMLMSRKSIRYKSNIPAALVTLVDPIKYYKSTCEEWQKEKAMLDEIKDEISPRVYNYILSEIDGIFMPNLVTYPYVCAAYQKKELQTCIADGYWNALDDFVLRSDDVSLMNPTYANCLPVYKEYMRCKTAGCDLKKFRPVRSVEDDYADLVDFYDGKLRDTALFVTLYNALANNGDFETIEKLVKDYLKKYNKNKTYKKILNQVMQ